MERTEATDKQFWAALDKYNAHHNNSVYSKLTDAIHEKQPNDFNLCCKVQDCALIMCGSPACYHDPLTLFHTTCNLIELDDSLRIYNMFLDWISLFL